MGLFKKKQNEQIKEETMNQDGVEILDFDKTEKVVNTLENRKENRVLFIILGVVVIFAFSLPFLSNLFSKTSIMQYNNNLDDINANNTKGGFIEIDNEEGNITAKKIKFYNIRKKTKNIVSVTYLPESGIKNVNDLNIYIELYNSNKIIINRTKFTSKEELGRKVQGTFKIELNETIYKEATYAKVVIIKDDEWGKTNDKLVCTFKENDNDFDVTYRVTYNFSDLGLQNYKVKRNAKLKEGENIYIEELPEETKNKYINMFKSENEELSKLDVKDILLDDNNLEYKIDFTEDKDYKPLYEKGSVKRQIKLGEMKTGWSCE